MTRPCKSKKKEKKERDVCQQSADTNTVFVEAGLYKKPQGQTRGKQEVQVSAGKIELEELEKCYEIFIRPQKI